MKEFNKLAIAGILLLFIILIVWHFYFPDSEYVTKGDIKKLSNDFKYYHKYSPVQYNWTDADSLSGLVPLRLQWTKGDTDCQLVMFGTHRTLIKTWEE